MKNYKITTRDLGGYPIEYYSESKSIIVKAKDGNDLMDKMSWRLDESAGKNDDEDDDERGYEYSNEIVFEAIESEGTFFFREDTELYDSELYIWMGENADGTRFEIEVVSDKEAKEVMKESKKQEKREEKTNLDRLNANSDEWDQFFMGKMPNEIMEELKKYKFPELI